MKGYEPDEPVATFQAALPDDPGVTVGLMVMNGTPDASPVYAKIWVIRDAEDAGEDSVPDTLHESLIKGDTILGEHPFSVENRPYMLAVSAAADDGDDDDGGR